MSAYFFLSFPVYLIHLSVYLFMISKGKYINRNVLQSSNLVNKFWRENQINVERGKEMKWYHYHEGIIIFFFSSIILFCFELKLQDKISKYKIYFHKFILKIWGSFNKLGEFFLKKEQNIFFYHCKFYIIWNRLIAKIILISLKYLIQNGGKSECSKIEQRSVIKFRWLRSANHVKFSEECMMWKEKHISMKKCLQMG